jgi:hypothetical protein
MSLCILSYTKRLSNNWGRVERMGKVTTSLVISFLFILPPVLVLAQGFSGARGFNGGGFARGSIGSFSPRSTVSGFRGGFGNRGVSSNSRTGLRSSRGFGNSGFSQRSASNFTPRTANTNTLEPQLPNASNQKMRLLASGNRFGGFGSRSFSRTDNFSPHSMGNKVIAKEEVNTHHENTLDTSIPARTEIIHWVNRRNGVSQFTNNVSSIPQGEKTTVVTGTQAVSSPRGLHAGSSPITSLSSEHTFSSTSRSTLGLVLKQTDNSIHSDHRFMVDNNQGSTNIVFNFFFGTPFFVSPFSFFPNSSFFFGFNPFNNFFFFNSFLVQPTFFPVFCNPFPFQPIFFFNTPVVAFNDVNID